MIIKERAYRGGAWYNIYEYTPSAIHVWRMLDRRDNGLGFRLVRRKNVS
jgi:formylglycine-generating enzyme required for sulfatase activity